MDSTEVNINFHPTDVQGLKTESSERNQESHLLSWNGGSIPERKICAESLEELVNSSIQVQQNFNSGVISF